MRSLFVSLAIATATAPLFAQPAAPGIPGRPDVTRVVAGTYKVDPAHTQVRWRVNHLGFSLFDGFFAEPEGSLVIDPRRPDAARVTITIPMNKVVSTSAGLDTHLKGADFFDVARFQTATFTSTQVRTTGQRARIAGDLTLRGVTRPVVLDARFIGAGDNPRGNKALNVGFEATTRISRSAFGITYGAPATGDAVDLTINAAFERT